MMTQMVHIAWRAAAFASKDTVDGMSDLVSETKWQYLTHTPLFLSASWMSLSTGKYEQSTHQDWKEFFWYIMASYLILRVYHPIIFKDSVVFLLRCLVPWGIWGKEKKLHECANLFLSYADISYLFFNILP